MTNAILCSFMANIASDVWGSKYVGQVRFGALESQYRQTNVTPLTLKWALVYPASSTSAPCPG